MSTQSEKDVVVIKLRGLPLHCFGPNRKTWNGHPRVFSLIQSNNEIECPHCGTYYRFDGEIPHHHY